MIDSLTGCCTTRSSAIRHCGCDGTRVKVPPPWANDVFPLMFSERKTMDVEQQYMNPIATRSYRFARPKNQNIELRNALHTIPPTKFLVRKLLQKNRQQCTKGKEKEILSLRRNDAEKRESRSGPDFQREVGWMSFYLLNFRVCDKEENFLFLGR